MTFIPNRFTRIQCFKMRTIRFTLMSSVYMTIILIYLINTGCYSYNINGSNNNNNCVANFCSDADNYPYDEIRKALARKPEFKIYSGVVVGIPNRGRRGIAEDRVAGEVCGTRIQRMHPQVGINVKKDVTTIVNTEEFKQEVPYITCINEECQQKYKLVELVVYEDDGSLSKNKFSVPLGCSIL